MSGNTTEAFAFEEGGLGFINGIGNLSLVAPRTDRFITNCRCHCVTLAIESLQEYMSQLVSRGAQHLTPEEAQKLLQVFQATIHNVHRNHDFQVWKPFAVNLGIFTIMDVKHVGIYINLRSDDAIDAIPPGQDAYLTFRAACQNFMRHLLADLRLQSMSKQPESLVWSFLPWDLPESNEPTWWNGDAELLLGNFEMATLLATRGIAPELKLAWNQ